MARELRPCGTQAAYRRHLERPDVYGPPCDDCLEENSRIRARQRANGPGGVDGWNARRRERRDYTAERARRRAKSATDRVEAAARQEALEALAHRHAEEFGHLLERARAEARAESRAEALAALGLAR